MILDATQSLLFSGDTSNFAPSALPKFAHPYLGRCPRLLHFAPLALGNQSFHTGSTAWVLTSRTITRVIGRREEEATAELGIQLATICSENC